ncbi:TPA: hypothetical protein JG851_004645 [Vibrio parahaemolyticus]|nr:TraK family protein [Vibrio parahaemolyticus]HBB9961478.1 hypothetical protein [Vibrio parahaemolyticus]HBB9976659.1 hypothetical protein [Vibrio parahaemolyticus]HBC0013210.1 hypothetical protein [Vibrio parahaemolyticus]
MKKRRNGRANFYSLRDEITKLINNGHTGTYIYEALKEENKLIISYPQFQRYLSEIKPKETPNNKRPSVQPLKTTPPSVKPNKSPQVTTTKSNTDEKPRDPFRRKTKPIHNPSMTPERRKELFG